MHLGSVQTRPEKIAGKVKTALFLPLGLSSTLICHENGCLKKRSSNRRNLKTSAFRFLVDGIYFENGALQKRLCHDNHVISTPELSKITGDCSVFKFLRRCLDAVLVLSMQEC